MLQLQQWRYNRLQLGMYLGKCDLAAAYRVLQIGLVLRVRPLFHVELLFPGLVQAQAS